jgi:hypothetical protein
MFPSTFAIHCFSYLLDFLIISFQDGHVKVTHHMRYILLAYYDSVQICADSKGKPTEAIRGGRYLFDSFVISPWPFYMLS